MGRAVGANVLGRSAANSGSEDLFNQLRLAIALRFPDGRCVARDGSWSI